MYHYLLINFQISLTDFKFWEIYPTIEQMKQGEESCLYPPRFKIKCKQIDTSQSLYFSLEISKRFQNKTTGIGQFLLIKEAKATGILANT